MLSVYEERGIVKGEQRGRAKGALQAKRDIACRQIGRKFGELPDAVRNRVQSMESEAELDSLLDAIVDATSLDDLRLTGYGSNGHAT